MRSLIEIQNQILSQYLKNFSRFIKILGLALIWNIGINSIPVSITMFTRFIIPVAGFSLVIALLTELCLTESFAELLEGRTILPAAAFSKGLRRLLPFLPIFLAWLIIVAAGSFLFLLPGIVFAIWLIFMFPIFMRERTAMPFTIFRRSKALVDGNFFRILLYVATVALAIFFVAVMAGQGLLSVLKIIPYLPLTNHSEIIASVFSAALFTLLTPLLTGTIVALYYDLRKLKGL